MGWNKYEFKSTIAEDKVNTKVMAQLIQLMVDGANIPLQLHGRGDTCPFPLLANAMSQLRVDVVAPPFPLPSDDDDDDN